VDRRAIASGNIASGARATGSSGAGRRTSLRRCFTLLARHTTVSCLHTCHPPFHLVVPCVQAWSSELKHGSTAEYKDYKNVDVDGFDPYTPTDSVALVSGPLRFAAQPYTLPRPLYMLSVVRGAPLAVPHGGLSLSNS
jgi:hypothetical protein